MAKKRTLRRKPNAVKPALELSRIERLLGEEFDTLAQARRALKNESTPVKKRSIPKRITPTPVEQPKTPKQKPLNLPTAQRAYTVRELRKGEKEEIIKWLTDYNATRRIQALKKQGEFWAAEVPYKVNDSRTGVKTEGIAKTYNIYADVYGLFAALSGYATSKKQSQVARQTTVRWLNNIKIVRFKGEDKSYKHHQRPKGKR